MSQSEIVVRPATGNDAAAIASLLGELGYPLDVVLVKENLAFLASSSSDIVLVAADSCADSCIVGVLSFHVMPLFHVIGKLGRISTLVVSAQWQRRGAGRKLVQAAEEFGWSQGCLKIEVTSGDHRAGAHVFYQSLGYELDERRFIKRPATG